MNNFISPFERKWSSFNRSAVHECLRGQTLMRTKELLQLEARLHVVVYRSTFTSLFLRSRTTRPLTGVYCLSAQASSASMSWYCCRRSLRWMKVNFNLQRVMQWNWKRLRTNYEEAWGSWPSQRQGCTMKPIIDLASIPDLNAVVNLNINPTFSLTFVSKFFSAATLTQTQPSFSHSVLTL